ncbi:L,D-transpeptidase family protein [Larkinella humicola]|uniref:L,D-transpeptidase family protein n=1 Tax=Larkinella humicola TaxID=2607654 RepID=A0A5N1JJD8_9BACT|nr:L,D-transpeptidase family protein [Larkinella humicola]KAA9356264.1 L,D-transpeptidase family protein [Larkinella humicola]
MNLKTLWVILILLTTRLPTVVGQTLPEWQNLLYRSGLDTTGVRLDSATLSRLAYELAYGNRPNRLSYWNLPEQIDSARINQVVEQIRMKAPDWVAQWHSLEPVFEPYQRLRAGLDSLMFFGGDSIPRWHEIKTALNNYRWLNRVASDLVVVVNIPSATLRVLNRQGNEVLQSRVIVGTPRTPTPLFGAQLTRIITYPYWNVPRSIAVKEFLPKIKRNPAGFLDAMKLQVLDAKGRIVAPESVNWTALSAQNFPYRLRQSTGCDNALGVMKFDVNSPFDIYLHDTNHRELFSNSRRFLSHGCIRVAKPVELANLLLGSPYFKPAFLESTQVNLPSRTVPLPGPVPVLIQYQTVDVNSAGTLVFYPDVYGWQTVKY